VVVAFGASVCAACAQSPRAAPVASELVLDRDLRDWVSVTSIASQCEESPKVVQRCGFVRDPSLFEARYRYAVRADVKAACTTGDDDACEIGWLRSHNDHVYETALRIQMARRKAEEPQGDVGRSAGLGIALGLLAVVGIAATKTLWSK